MARLRSLTRGTQKVQAHPTEVDATYQVVSTEGGPLLHLSTFGSDARQSEPKSSQTLQLDRERALELMAVLEDVFGADSTVQDVRVSEAHVESSVDRPAEHRLKIDYLDAATRKPIVKVTERDPVSRARTLMDLHDYSQLPVVKGRGDRATGMISWESIGRAGELPSDAVVADVMQTVTPMPLSTSLLDAIPAINRDGFVVTKAGDGTIEGIVTSADLGDALAGIAGPYLELAECESLLRAIVADAMTSGRLSSTRANEIARSFDGGPISAVDDLPLGMSIALFCAYEVWAGLSESLDRATMQRELNGVARARNAVMHFRQRSEDDLAVLARLPRLNALLRTAVAAP